MTGHRVGINPDWIEALLGLARAEKELTRLSDDRARRQQQLH